MEAYCLIPLPSKRSVGIFAETQAQSNATSAYAEANRNYRATAISTYQKDVARTAAADARYAAQARAVPIHGSQRSR